MAGADSGRERKRLLEGGLIRPADVLIEAAELVVAVGRGGVGSGRGSVDAYKKDGRRVEGEDESGGAEEGCGQRPAEQ
ncbi:hypothetical protein ACN28E_10250 [Archangium lansingense]|uniref:hypothetical protein n=1 Tax=Archangium lansingense TaxID=2995310 RepID=UPI003B7B537F